MTKERLNVTNFSIEFKIAGWIYIHRLSAIHTMYYYIERYTPFDCSKRRNKVYDRIMMDD